jgi:hypothetical protein
MTDSHTAPLQHPFTRRAKRLDSAENEVFDGAGLSLTTETITPDIAARWLTQNITNNRSVSPRHIAGLARDIQAGRWALNGETIKFSPPTPQFPNGELMDGQQRLHACISAGRPFVSAVVRGVESLDDVDRSRSRTLGHALEMRGYRRPIKLATALSTIWRWEFTNWRANNDRATIREATTFLEEHSDLIYDALKYGTRIGHIESSIENSSLVFWRLARTYGEDVAASIFSRIGKSNWDGVNDPLWRYYELAARAKAAARKTDKIVRLNWLIRAVDASLRGEEHSSFHYLRWNVSKKLRFLTDEGVEGTK